MSQYQPDYKRIILAAQNKRLDYFPLYEHNVSLNIIESITGKPLEQDFQSGKTDNLCVVFQTLGKFFVEQGYDTYSFEGCLTTLIQQGKGLTGTAGPLFTKAAELEQYPWESLEDRYFEHFKPYFDAIRKTLPEGMKIVGGVGNGVFESVQDFMPYTELAYLEVDDPGMYGAFWQKVGDTLLRIWIRFLEEYSDILAVARFGDDLGFKSALLLSPQTIRDHVIPQYKKIVGAIKSRKIPFLLHSCGHIFDVMGDLIETVGIDAKHSNEDAIAPFQRWVDDYGAEIGNFGGLDMDVICRETEENLRSYIRTTLSPLMHLETGMAFGSGNQIASYVPPRNFLTMVDEIRKLRGA